MKALGKIAGIGCLGLIALIIIMGNLGATLREQQAAVQDAAKKSNSNDGASLMADQGDGETRQSGSD